MRGRAAASGSSSFHFDRERADLVAAWMPALLHRLNNASGVVQGMAELLRDGTTGGARLQHVDLLLEQARVISNVLRLLGGVALGRGEARAAVDLHEIVQEAVELLDLVHKTQLRAALAPRRGLTIVRARPDELRLFVCRLLHAATPSLWGRRNRRDPELALRVHGDRACVRLVLCTRDEAAWGACVGHAAALDGRLRTRPFGARRLACVAWPGVDASSDA